MASATPAAAQPQGSEAVIKAKKRQLAIGHFELGSILQSDGDKEGAFKEFNIAIELDGTFAPPRFEFLKNFLRNDDPRSALVKAQEILQADRTFMAPKFMNEIIPSIIKRIDDQNKANVKRTPVTILTGFLGSGKTTLLNRILSENHGHKIAVIENEFGAVGIDEKLVIANKYDDEMVVEIMNGCICCTVREDLAKTLCEMKKNYIDVGKIDYIILETTGMADPAPVIQTFFVHPDIQDWAYVDACITVCDASNIIKRMMEDREEGCENEAVEQVCFADKILLNKVDLCTEEELTAATAKIREFNAQSPIDRTQLSNADIPFDKLLDIKAFDIQKALEIDEQLLIENNGEEHKHDSRIGTFSYRMEAEMTVDGANEFFGKVLRENGENIYRMKGFLAIAGSPMKIVFHSVGMLCATTPLEQWKPDEKRECVFVIIGKHLQQSQLEDYFKNAAIEPPKDFAEIEHPNPDQYQKSYAAQQEEEKKD